MNYDLFSVEGLSREEIEKIAFESGFRKRRSGKIEPPDFLIHFCLQSLEGTVSYNDIAARVEAKAGINVSRQAFHQRMNDRCVKFFEKILEIVIASKYCSENITELIASNKFLRIIVQDSTVVRLPLRLFDIFSGVKNAHSAVCNARIQAIYDLISKKFIAFSIDPYSKNDLSVARDISVKSGDLVVRDRGYFTVESTKELKENGADAIFRYKHKTKFFDIESGEEISLLKLLSEYGSIDMMVLMGNEKCKARILAKPVNEEVANLRRMKAKKESNSKNPSKELLALMSWTIFITTIESSDFTFEMIFKLYALRWRIENIFKTWKSNFNFDKIHNVSKNQLRVLFTARLIMIVFIYQRLFNPLSIEIKKAGKRLSLMKFTLYIRNNIEVIHKILNVHNIDEKTIKALIRFCTYDHRKRENFESQIERILLETTELAVGQMLA